MSVQEKQHLSDHDLARYAGFPVYFFDFAFLLDQVSKIANWDRDKLESVIGARADNMLDRADVRLPAPGGFHIMFSSHDQTRARERAHAIRTDILKHFFGMDSLIPERAHAFCRPSDLNTAMSRGSAPEHSAEPSLAENRTGVSRYLDNENRKSPRFQFAPMWNSTNERITAFSCQPAPLASWGIAAGEKTSVSPTARCATDIAALSFALKGVEHIISHGDIALVSVPVHIETLSWSKQRAAYQEELARIELRFLSLLVFRIFGLDSGSSITQLGQAASALRCHAPRIHVHLPTVDLDLSLAGSIGVTGLGVSAPSHPGSGEHQLNELKAVATHLKLSCASQHAMAYMDNVNSRAAVHLLKAQGVRLIAGSVLGSSSEMPGQTTMLPLSAITDRGATKFRPPLNVTSRTSSAANSSSKAITPSVEPAPQEVVAV